MTEITSKRQNMATCFLIIYFVKKIYSSPLILYFCYFTS